MAKSRGVKATYDKTSPRMDFRNWNLAAAESVEAMVETLALNILKEAFSLATNGEPSNECIVGFKLGDFGNADVDPDIVKVELPIGAYELEGPVWEFSLAETVDWEIARVEHGAGGVIEGPEDREPLEALAAHLDAQAAKIRAALDRKLSA